MSSPERQYRLVLIHGFLGTDDDWQAVIQAISKKTGHQIYAPILPGHGEHPTELSTPGLQGMANWLAGYINDLENKNDRENKNDIENKNDLDEKIGVNKKYDGDKKNAAAGEQNLFLVGYSLGGRILLNLAAQVKAGQSQLIKPSTIAGMIIESANPGLAEADKANRWQQDKLWSQRFAAQSINESLANWYQQSLFDDLTAEVRAKLVRQRRASNPAALAKVILSCSLARQPDYRGLMLNPPFPVHYWYGLRDEKFRDIAGDLRQLQTLRKSQKSAEDTQPLHPLTITAFADAGHNCHLAVPAEYTRRLLAVLSDHAF